MTSVEPMLLTQDLRRQLCAAQTLSFLYTWTVLWCSRRDGIANKLYYYLHQVVLRLWRHFFTTHTTVQPEHSTSPKHRFLLFILPMRETNRGTRDRSRLQSPLREALTAPSSPPNIIFKVKGKILALRDMYRTHSRTSVDHDRPGT